MVGAYDQRETLQVPEERIVEMMRSDLGAMDMLDIGVGGGRTSVRFAPLVRSYIGIDYSKAMIEACRARLGKSMPQARFEHGDATCLDSYGDASFDFILFSYNGIDYVSEDGRAKVFAEVMRVLRSDGYFCFSTHNIHWTRQMNLLRDQWSIRPIRTIRRIAGWIKWWWGFGRHLDRSEIAELPYAIINDGAHGCRLNTYYVNPSFQILSLKRCFREVRVVTLTTGNVVDSSEDLSLMRDPWLYYLCRGPLSTGSMQSYS